MSNEITWRWQKAPIGMAEIRNVEQLLGVKLPDDYIQCALINHGGYPTPDTFDLPGRPQAVFSHLLDYFHTQAKNKNPSILQVYTSIQNRLPAGIVPFAADPFGNFVCFDFRKQATPPTVVFWDHEVAFHDREKALSFVCNSFSELLSKLYELEDEA